MDLHEAHVCGHHVGRAGRANLCRLSDGEAIEKTVFLLVQNNLSSVNDCIIHFFHAPDCFFLGIEVEITETFRSFCFIVKHYLCTCNFISFSVEEFQKIKIECLIWEIACIKSSNVWEVSFLWWVLLTNLTSHSQWTNTLVHHIHTTWHCSMEHVWVVAHHWYLLLETTNVWLPFLSVLLWTNASTSSLVIKELALTSHVLLRLHEHLWCTTNHLLIWVSHELLWMLLVLVVWESLLTTLICTHHRLSSWCLWHHLPWCHWLTTCCLWLLL